MLRVLRERVPVGLPPAHGVGEQDPLVQGRVAASTKPGATSRVAVTWVFFGGADGESWWSWWLMEVLLLGELFEAGVGRPLSSLEPLLASFEIFFLLPLRIPVVAC